MLSHKKILEYHYKNRYEGDFGTDHDEAHCRCWRCGYIRDLERCHVIPKSLGGSNSDPANFVLLCSMCHEEAPDVKDKNAMFEWIKSTKVSHYDYFWKARSAVQYCFDSVCQHGVGKDSISPATHDWVISEIRKMFPFIFIDSPQNQQNILNSVRAAYKWDSYPIPIQS